MSLAIASVAEPNGLVEALNFAEKVERSKQLIREAYDEFGDSMIVAHSLGKDSVVVWDLVKQVAPDVRGFVVTTRHKPNETVAFMGETVMRYPEIEVYRNDDEIPPELHTTDPDRCCELLKVKPTARALEQMGARCWVTGLRCTEGRIRTDYLEWEVREKNLTKLNPILIWLEREIWQYLAIHQVPVNPLYSRGYRSLGCEPCTRITTAPDERAGRWIGTSKCGGECGIHTHPLLEPDYQI
jgi:phosphoadenosine phosphosulfate reductase